MSDDSSGTTSRPEPVHSVDVFASPCIPVELTRVTATADRYSEIEQIGSIIAWTLPRK